MRTNRILVATLTLSALICASQPGFAASVSGVSGTLAGGQEVVVSGTGFGSTGPRVILFDDFDGGRVGETLAATGPKVGRWTLIKNFPNYSSDYRRSGTNSVAVSNFFPNDFGRNCPSPAGGCDGDNYSALGIDFGYFLSGGEAMEAYWEYSYFVVPGSMFPLETGYRINYKTSWIYGYRADHSNVQNDWRLFAGNAAPSGTGVLSAGWGNNPCPGCSDLITDPSCGSTMYPTETVLTSPKGKWVRHMEYARGSTGCNGELSLMEAPFINRAADSYSCRSNALNICAGGSRAGRSCTGNDQCPGSSCNYENAGGDRNTCEIIRKERTGHRTLQPSIGSSGWGSLTLNAYASNADGRPVGAGGYQWRYDDVYIAIGPGARARVVLANYATWGDTAHGDTLDTSICTPNSWSDLQVACTVRPGAFTSGQTLYLFVVDASGNISDQNPSVPGAQGFPVVLGGTSTAPNTPPAFRIN